jgi:ethanolamine utilization protein EutM
MLFRRCVLRMSSIRSSNNPSFSVEMIRRLFHWRRRSPTRNQHRCYEPGNTHGLRFYRNSGFTAVFEAIDSACKAAGVEGVGKEKLGGGYVTVIIQGQLSAVTAAIDTGKTKVDGLGKLIAAHVIARPSEAVLKLLPKS